LFDDDVVCELFEFAFEPKIPPTTLCAKELPIPNPNPWVIDEKNPPPLDWDTWIGWCDGKGGGGVGVGWNFLSSICIGSPNFLLFGNEAKIIVWLALLTVSVCVAEAG